MLLLVPVALFLMSGLGLLALSLRNANIAKASCRRAVWLAQVDMSKAMTELIRLNPEARRLRRQRRLIEYEIKAAIVLLQPELVLALRAQLALVTIEQLRLRQNQERLLFQARSARAAASTNFIERTRLIHVSHISPVSSTSGLAVRFSPPSELTPDAIPLPQFSEQQKLSLRWQAQLLNKAPLELLKLMKIENPILRGQCTATLRTEKTKWQPQLVADKF
ncbi:MAG: hypothetical protein AB7K41_09645 [Bdellovibrionales bacterium]